MLWVTEGFTQKWEYNLTNFLRFFCVKEIIIEFGVYFFSLSLLFICIYNH